MIFKLLERRRARTLFSILSVALGIASLVALNAIVQGTIHQYERLATEFRGDVMVQRAGMPDPALSQVDPEYAAKLALLPQVLVVHPVSFYAIKLLKSPKGTGAGTRFFVMTGMPTDSQLLRRHSLVSGRYFSDDRNEIILGEQAATDLGLREGDSLAVDKSSYTIVGLYRTGIRLMDKGAILSLHNIQSLRRTPNVNLLVLDLKDPLQANDVSKKIEELFPDLEALRSADVLDSFDQVKIFRQVAFGISLITLIIAVVGILNSMIMSVYERTREIGILRALGWSRRMVVSLIVGESVALSSVGGAVGLILGVVGTEALISTINIGLVDAYYPFYLPFLAVGASLVVGLIGAAVPAVRAMRITPLEALRHE